MTLKKRKTKKRTKRKTKKIGGAILGMLKSGVSNKINQATAAAAKSAVMSKLPNVNLALPQLKMATNAVTNIARKGEIPKTNNASSGTNSSKINNALSGAMPAGLSGALTGAMPAGLTGALTGAMPPGLTGALTGAMPAGLTGAMPAGLTGAMPAGLSGALTGAMPAGLTGALPPGLTGALPPGLSGALPAGLSGALPPGLTTGVNSLTGPLTKGLMSDPKAALKNIPQFKMASNTLSKSGLADKGSGILSTLKIFKAYPMGTLLIKTIMKSYENVMLLKHIFKSNTLRHSKYKKQINELTTDQKKDFDIACCLIKRFYIQDIAKNYSYFRETDFITENCKVVKYIQTQVKLFNSVTTKYQKHFTEIFTNNITKFANISNNVGSKTLDEMQQEIEDAFTIGKNNYSYIILFLLHDIIKKKIILPANCDYTYKEEKCPLEESITAMLA